jgi:Tfp pilus assembly protein PilN
MKRKIEEVIAVGEEPRVNLLPPEVRQRRRAKVVRRRIGFLVILMVTLILGGTALIRAQALQSQRQLAIATMNTKSLKLQQDKYGQVQKIQDQVDTIEAAQQVGTSTEIDWKAYLISVQATLPANVTLDTINVDSATPFVPYTQATAPLQGSRIATLSFTAKSATLPKVPTWLIALTSLRGYADASPGSVTRNEAGGYLVNITMHINESAFTHRFASASNQP